MGENDNIIIHKLLQKIVIAILVFEKFNNLTYKTTKRFQNFLSDKYNHRIHLAYINNILFIPIGLTK